MNKQVKIEVPANVTGMEVWKAFQAKGKPVLQISEAEWEQAGDATNYYSHWSEISTQGHKVALAIDPHGRHVVMLKDEGFIFQRYCDSTTTWVLNGTQKLHDNVSHTSIGMGGWKYICERFKIQPIVESEPVIVEQSEEEMAPKDKVIKITVTNEQATPEANQIKEEVKMNTTTQATSALNLNSDMNNAAPAVSTNTENLGISTSTGVLVAAGAALGTCLGIQYVENRFDLVSNVITGAAVTLAAGASFGAAKAGLNEKLGTYTGIASHAALGALVGGVTAHGMKYGAGKYLPTLELQGDATELALIEGTELPVLEA